MKCPKCGYLGFDDDRCRNCGYDFSLTDNAPAAPELTIRSKSDSGETFEDLPLFGDDAPLITKASPPRPPLAVRRATPEVPRLRSEPTRAPMLDLEAVDLEGRRRDTRESDTRPADPGAGDAPAAAEPAGLFARSIALVIDLVLLTSVDVLVIYFTMQICGLTADDLGVLPRAPLIAFLLLQNGGYLVAFTLGGQTLGKMAMGLRVVPAGADAPLDLGRSIVRTLVWLALALPAGLGFLTALFSSDRRGLHDRCAGTRVVRAT
jgi:uncharacterized RDD family membrane protein YckC